MTGAPPRGFAERADRLQRCIRDLAALNALPSMCVGRTAREALDIILEALPTALSCDLVYLQLPGTPPKERGSFKRTPLGAADLDELRLSTTADGDGVDAQVFLAGGRLWCLEADVPVDLERGRLLAGRTSPLDDETDRVLLRNAANIVGTILQTAHVLEAARRKDDFLAMLGHELRNPLAPIVTAVELLARHPAVAREREVIDRHARHLSRLVDDLLDISRITQGNVLLQREQVPLATILKSAVEIATPLVVRHNHALSVADAGNVVLEGDVVRLAQVFGNLLTNAAKFTPTGGRIDVEIEPLGARVRVTVRDNGRGIAPDQLERIFEPFVQVDRARDALQGGLGLGLAIVSNLVQRQGGSMSVESKGRGHGAAFTVELPVAARAVEPGTVSKVPPRPTEARAAVRVLVVDDNVDVAELLSEALQDVGFQTAVAHDGRGALAQWRCFRPHVGVLDVGLPDLDGFDLARAVRAEHGDAATLIAATGYSQPTERVKAADAGFDCYLVKPVSVDELVVVLDERVVPAAAPADAARTDPT